jgi:hypothetical protein
MASMTTGMAPEMISHAQLGTRLTSLVDEADEKFATSWSPTSHPFRSAKIGLHTQEPHRLVPVGFLERMMLLAGYNDAELPDVPTQVNHPSGV